MDISKYKGLYLQETNSHLSGVEEGLLALEKAPADAAIIDNLFRHFHSIKGMSASMGYTPVMKLAHAGEDLLERMRKGLMQASTGTIETLLAAYDAMKGMVRRIEEGQALSAEPAQTLIGRIRGLIDVSVAQGVPPRPGPPGPLAADAGAGADADASGAQQLRLSSVMKVDGRVFDGLLATVGDLFMSLSSLKTLAGALRSVAFKDGLHAMGRSINALYESILVARMLPVEDLTAGLPRVIRDLSKRSGKEVDLRVEGADIRLDRAILEGLGSPLVHIIRNSVDHGIETPKERSSAGKPGAGSIRVKAFARKDRVVIAVSDDGRGFDVEKIKAGARARGFTDERMRSMGEKEVLMLTCLPGLTTADAVTDSSGRGVGMDVVKGAVEALGGTLSIESGPGKGSTIAMELPRTSSIVKTLIVVVADEVFLLPLSRIEVVLEVEARVAAGDTFLYNGSDIPLVRLSSVLGLPEGGERGVCTVVVVEAAGVDAGDGIGAGGAVALRVDGFRDEVDAYVKPLTPPMARLWGVSGITVMGDGTPAFLLDVAQITAKGRAASCWARPGMAEDRGGS
jgi:two-component system chemotaxis sensor kinase CheA